MVLRKKGLATRHVEPPPFIRKKNYGSNWIPTRPFKKIRTTSLITKLGMMEPGNSKKQRSCWRLMFICLFPVDPYSKCHVFRRFIFCQIRHLKKKTTIFHPSKGWDVWEKACSSQSARHDSSLEGSCVFVRIDVFIHERFVCSGS